VGEGKVYREEKSVKLKPGSKRAIQTEKLLKDYEEASM
jgi:hypothetical protein